MRILDVRGKPLAQIDKLGIQKYPARFYRQISTEHRHRDTTDADIKEFQKRAEKEGAVAMFIQEYGLSAYIPQKEVPRMVGEPQAEYRKLGAKPSRHDVAIGTWAERDRIGIWLTDKRTNKEVAEWWDEDAQEMFEQGFFKAGDIRHQTITGRAFEESVLDYAESVGILAGGKFLPQTVKKETFFWTAINKSTGEITESTVPYTSTGRALRGGRSFASRHWKGNEALVEVWKQPYRYSESLKIQPVSTERLNPSSPKTALPQTRREPSIEKGRQYWHKVNATQKAIMQRMGASRVVEVHSDGDVTFEAEGRTYVLTTSGEVFDKVGTGGGNGPGKLPQTMPERGVDYYKVPPDAY